VGRGIIMPWELFAVMFGQLVVYVLIILYINKVWLPRKKAEGYVLRGFWIFKRLVKDEPKE
jgi:hypothetical protein